MEFYFAAYAQLSTCRGAGDLIPWDVIDRYAVRYGFEGELYDWFVSAMRAMDDHFLSQAKRSNNCDEASG